MESVPVCFRSFVLPLTGPFMTSLSGGQGFDRGSQVGLGCDDHLQVLLGFCLSCLCMILDALQLLLGEPTFEKLLLQKWPKILWALIDDVLGEGLERGRRACDEILSPCLKRRGLC